MAKHPAHKFWKIISSHPLFQEEETRVFTIALVASLFLHTVLLATVVYRNVRYSKKIQKNIEVIYQAVMKKEKNITAPREYKAIKEIKPLPVPRSLAEKEAMRSVFSPSLNKPAAKIDLAKASSAQFDMRKQPLKMSGPEGKRHVSVPILNSEKITNPKYLGYHDQIRNKIKNRAYMYVDNPAFANGEVYLTFVVAASGEVTAVKVIEEKTKANDYLRAVGLRSIKESSPFSAFPADLKYPELTFNVVISFETGE